MVGSAEAAAVGHRAVSGSAERAEGFGAETAQCWMVMCLRGMATLCGDKVRRCAGSVA